MASALLYVLLLTACATPPQTLRLARHPTTDVPVRMELSATPFFPQQRYQCGPAALATVLTGLGIDTTPESLQSLVYLPGRKGSLQVEMMAMARHYELLPVRLAPQLDALILELAAGNPVLILQNLAFSWAPRWHYAVVVGYDLDKQVFILRSGTTRHRVTSFATFERTWRRSGYWAVTVVPPDRISASADALVYLQAVHALEASGHLMAARHGYQSAGRRWPGNPVALMGSGNTAYALKDYAAAERAFRQILALHPAEAAAWNNLGYALHAQGCQQEAISVARCAQMLAPGDPGFRDSVRELAQGSLIPGATCQPVPGCPLP